VKSLAVSEATAPLSHYLRDVRREPVIFTDDGRPVAALVSLAGVDSETGALSINPQFLSIISRSEARLKAEGGISGDEMRRRLGL
jgi:prevent-host-death family protein